MRDKAAELFSRHGFRAVGMRQITQASGVTFQTAYNNFEARETLVKEVLEWRHHGVIEEMQALIDQVQGIDARLKAVFDWHARWFKSAEFAGCLFERAIAEYGISDPELSDVAIKHKKALLNLLEKTLREEFRPLEARQLASMILMLLDGATSHARAFHDPSVIRRASKATQALLKETRHQRKTGAAVID